MVRPTVLPLGAAAPVPAWGRRTLLRVWCCCVPVFVWACAPAALATADAAAAIITTITLERHCSGCAGVATLVLQRDGRATLTQAGLARQGEADRVSRGKVAGADFERLAQLTVRLGFMALDEVYQDPTLADGAWAMLSVVRGGQVKSVFQREDAGPPALQALQQAVLALQTRISFVAVP